jgi:hypothetical protein
MTFPNLARNEPFTDVDISEVTAICEAELKAAGINADWKWPASMLSKTEVPNLILGSINLWGFERAWYYWIARGPGIPSDLAEKLHTDHGREVRVDGHCGCPSPKEWFRGFAVGHYHVDTPKGLKALADLIHQIYGANP